MIQFIHRSGIVVLFALGLLGPRIVAGQGVEYLKSHYTKYEYRIPMRDGKQAVHVGLCAQRRFAPRIPILLKRTPYSVKPYGVDQYPENLGPSPLFGKEGYIFVYQDVRGRWMSEGEFVQMRPHRPREERPDDFDESTDTWDTVDWLVKNVRGNNGKVGIAGISYPGFYTAAGIIDSHPAIKAASPQAPVNDWFVGDDWHHNGAFFLAHMFNWMSRSGRVRPEPTKDLPASRSTTALPMATSSIAASRRCRRLTRSTSRATSRSGKRRCGTERTTSSGSRATSART